MKRKLQTFFEYYKGVSVFAETPLYNYLLKNSFSAGIICLGIPRDS